MNIKFLKPLIFILFVMIIASVAYGSTKLTTWRDSENYSKYCYCEGKSKEYDPAKCYETYLKSCKIPIVIVGSGLKYAENYKDKTFPYFLIDEKEDRFPDVVGKVEELDKLNLKKGEADLVVFEGLPQKCSFYPIQIQKALDLLKPKCYLSLNCAGCMYTKFVFGEKVGTIQNKPVYFDTEFRFFRVIDTDKKDGASLPSEDYVEFLKNEQISKYLGTVLYPLKFNIIFDNFHPYWVKEKPPGNGALIIIQKQ